jgi:valyl-tRNA synthetase
MAKLDMRREDATPGDRQRVWAALSATLADLLRLLHPLMPFVTEEIWSTLGTLAPEATRGEPLLVTARWPTAAARDRGGESEMEQLRAMIRDVRTLRAESGVPAGAWLPLVIEPADDRARAIIERGRRYLEPMARARPMTLAGAEPRPDAVAATTLGAAWLGTEAGAQEAGEGRRRRQVEELKAGIERIRALLANPSFVERAPAAVVDKERARLADLEAQLRQLG